MAVTSMLQHGYVILILCGVVICLVVALYLGWHLFFMVFFPTRKALLGRKPVEEPCVFAPELGLTLADGGEKVGEAIKREGEEKEEG
jgi:hypothetical protein